MERVIFHVDVNSAFLSFEAVYRLQHGEELDLREIPAAVGGDRKKRSGIILAKSLPCKKYGIRTGEPVTDALQKCPHLHLVPGNYDLYAKCSRALFELLRRYTDQVCPTGIEEGFLDVTDVLHTEDEIVPLAERIRTAIKSELGFTVSVGVSSNRLLAKMASDLRKPDFVTTLFPHELERKMWPLAVGDLMMVGRATKEKLRRIGVRTIGDLAHIEPSFLYRYLKSAGTMLWRYANGIESEENELGNMSDVKSIGNSRTMPFDLTTKEEAYMAYLSICEKVGMRLRAAGYEGSLISVMYKSSSFVVQEHQAKLAAPSDHTNEIYHHAQRLFDELWDGSPIRSVGVRVSELSERSQAQISLFDPYAEARHQRLDASLDKVRERFGSESIHRACFLGSAIRPIASSLTKEERFADILPFMNGAD